MPPQAIFRQLTQRGLALWRWALCYVQSPAGLNAPTGYLPATYELKVMFGPSRVLIRLVNASCFKEPPRRADNVMMGTVLFILPRGTNDWPAQRKQGQLTF
jgi:hypothetical protein